MKKISIVIPVFNEEYFIAGLLRSIAKLDYPPDAYDVNVVSDGCTDGTVSVVRGFAWAHLIELTHNVGRYEARRTGAVAAKHPNILFIDARCVVEPGMLAAIDRSGAAVIIPRVLGEEKPGLFETFFSAVRRKVFWRYYANSSKRLELTEQNFDSLPKGTTALFVEKSVLLRAYDDLAGLAMGKDSSDDTRLIRAIVQHAPAVLDPEVRITNFYRRSFRAGLSHLFMYMAPSFLDYYLRPSQQYFWLVIVLPLMALLLLFLALILAPLSPASKIAGVIGLDIVAGLLLARTAREFSVILLMLPITVLTFYAGIIRGLFLKAYRAVSHV